MLVVNEIFYSIQGESSWAGLPCVFVRLTACNLRCTWCDTTYSFHEGRPMTVGDVIVKVLEYNCPLVEITGGEPLLQPNVYPLMTRLCDLGKRVLLETSGSVDVSRVDPRVVKIMDLKCPSSGESHRNLFSNLDHLDKKDELKFVIADRADYEWARDVLHRYDLQGIGCILFSPVWDRLPLRTLAEWILADRLPVRLQTQWHKIIWGANARGV
ncbi:MAG: radical SAM protein [Verrucomicrobiae bacterium]|nr:radical SAM protein [Verrucomicrobiae bacterium]